MVRTSPTNDCGSIPWSSSRLSFGPIATETKDGKRLSDKINGAFLTGVPTCDEKTMLGLPGQNDLQDAIALPVKLSELRGRRKVTTGVPLFGPPGEGVRRLAWACAIEKLRAWIIHQQ
ncbi:uncharacterized protein PAC_03960 [Phialocephala subalpina]|uniref:Uncharacterized protein n=1 Tax=Phialocephala subalpina TaxID=576137 RepID=A0A1L7WMR9_9HELO|nr:uncharacterized protein PAC_03960 [Phialocephala subalpina]